MANGSIPKLEWQKVVRSLCGWWEEIATEKKKERLQKIHVGKDNFSWLLIQLESIEGGLRERCRIGERFRQNHQKKCLGSPSPLVNKPNAYTRFNLG